MSATEAAASIRIDIVADITCPWCYIGKRQLEAAIASYASASRMEVDLHWRPFQLDPNLPPAGLDLQAYAAAKPDQDILTNQKSVTEAGKEVGLRFAWDKITRMPNTFDAHRLVQHALLYGVQTKIVERLFKAYFCEGVDIGNRQRLAELGEECGIDSYAIETLFNQSEDILTIEEDLAIVRNFNLPKVPFFVFADDIIVPGIGSPQLFTAALFRAQETQSRLDSPPA